MRNLAVLMGAILFLAASHVHAAVDPALELRAQLAAIEDKARQSDADMGAIHDALVAVIGDPQFSALSETERHDAYYMRGFAALQLGNVDEAASSLDAALALQGDHAFDWRTRLYTAEAMRDGAKAAESLSALARLYPAMLAYLDDDVVFHAAGNAARYMTPAENSALQEALAANNWQPKDTFLSMDGISIQLVATRLEHGDAVGAALAAMHIRDPDTLITMLTDKRFDPITQIEPGDYDVSKGLADSIALYRSKAAAAPDKLEGVVMLTNFLVRAGRFDETLTLVDGALKRLKSNPNAYSDAADEQNWVLDARARALAALGRFDEALSVRVAAAKLDEDGGVNVSQAINLADAYDDFGRPHEALAATETIGGLSGYGAMAYQKTRACAFAQLGDKDGLAQSLAYMRAHEAASASQLLDAELCAGNMDEAAAAVIRLLANPGARGDIIGELQDFKDLPTPPQAAEMRKRWRALAERPDVAAEVAKYGRVLSWPIYPQ